LKKCKLWLSLQERSRKKRNLRHYSRRKNLRELLKNELIYIEKKKRSKIDNEERWRRRKSKSQSQKRKR